MRTLVSLLLALILGVPANAGRNFNGSAEISANGIGTALDIYTGPVVISVWFYPTLVDSSEHDILNHFQGAVGSQFLIGLGAGGSAGNTVFWNVGNGGPLTGVYGTCGTISENQWYHALLIVDPAGVLFHTPSAEFTVEPTGGGCGSQGYRESRTAGGYNFVIGGGNGETTTATFHGTIAEVAVWTSSSILSNGFLTALQTICPEGPSARRMGLPNPVGYFPLYGASGTSIEPDLSGNANNGTITAATPSNHPPCTP